MTVTMAPGQHFASPTDNDPVHSAAHADTATGLLDAMLAAPVGHPCRLLLRNEAIEAWLPLARACRQRVIATGAGRRW